MNRLHCFFRYCGCLLFVIASVLPVVLMAQQPLVRYKEFFSGQDMAHTRVSCFYQDREGFLWMGSWIGLCRYDGQQFTFFRAMPGDDNPQDNNRVTKIGETAGGQLWCMTVDRRLYSFDRQRCTFDSLSADSIPARRLEHHSEARPRWSMTDAYGVRWTMNDRERLCWVDTATGSLHPVEEALDDRDHGELPITDYHIFFVDQSRNLWVSSGTRLFRLSFGQRQTQSLALPELDEVRAMWQEDEDYVLLGDKQSILCRMRLSDRHREYLTPQGRWVTSSVPFAAQGIYCLLRDRKHRLWLGTRGDGLYCIDHGKISHFLHHDADAYSLKSDHVYAMIEDREGVIWLSLFEEGGLCRLDEADDGTLRFIHAGNEWHDYPPSAVSARCLAQDASGRILVGTNEGLLIYDPSRGSWRLCRHATSDVHSLPGNTVMSILTRGANTYVLSYGFGISRLVLNDGGEAYFETVANHDFPMGDICVAAQLDAQGRVWGLGESGFSCYELQPDFTVCYFNDYDLGGRYTFCETQPLQLTSGVMLMGMRGGLLSFDVNRLHKEQQQPRIHVTRLSYPGLMGEEVHYVCALDSLVLTPHRRSVSIQFSDMDFQSSSLKRYAYRLLNPSSSEQPEWTITTQPEVNFIDLPAGHYLLQMRATNADGVWGASFSRLPLYVVPTFWETRWAWLVWLLALVSLAALIGFTVSYIFRLRQQKIELEAVLERHLKRSEEETTISQAPENDFLTQLMSFLEAHIGDDDLSIPALAEQMNMSQATLYRKLKSMVGLSPADFFRKLKIRRAVQLLESQADLTISQIAYSVGFSDPKYFAKCFKHEMGESPMKYRLKIKGNN